ncbi:ATP-binding cassette domain-containing protein [Labedaea rhizosphaerae]|uniref:ABC-type quaternary amine transporter n=1 Tax=Labedaea rhizosphaerae TaxID=598644 RepID=A0A4R6S2H8_LABRH|nr:ATP-binding cassette domain-containing protein [Labedaea rhizosphaerae]TDP93780.1 osmoprotectant transport system ATP-binding protein [Labedaea rhizosphaerae]
MIEFRDVTKRYPDGTVAVDELSLSVEAGTITVFVGPSGCGKTTSLRMVNRMIEATSGQVLVDGQDVAKQKPAQLRRGIGYVIQQAGLFPHRTVLDNVATVPLLSGWSKAKARTRASELLELVGLPVEFGKRYPAQLSGGQQQRVGVARALAADPPILLMDEPFSAVDPVVREGLQDELLRLQAELDKTIVFVTHDIDEAIKLGEKVAVFRVGGKLAQYAEPAELLRAPADEFVSSFVGRDRGYRGLGFLSADGIAVEQLETVPVGAAVPTTNDWVLVVDGERKPVGWLRPGSSSTVDGTVTADGLEPGGSLYDVEGGNGTTGSLRSAMDAALSSPSGHGVAVDGSGAVVGRVSAESVLAALSKAREQAATA